jgi:4-amino-4-deoxy-L-arabinose transferase-like glycosyltransferase
VLVTAGLGFGLLFAGGAMVLALGFALAHLLVPILLIVGIVWLIRRGSQPRPALPLQH